MTNRKLTLKSCAVRGPAGKSAYDAAVDAGYTGTDQEFYALLAGMPEMVSQFEEMTQQLQEIKDYFDELYSRGFSESAKTDLLDILEHVAYVDQTGRQLHDDLEDELFPPVGVVSIAATFDQGQAVIYDTDSLSALRPYLTVMATFEDRTVRRVTDYAMAGTLTAGTSTITVTYGGQSDTFDVIVTHDVRDVLISISAVYTQSGTVYDTDSLDSLKSDLVVTALYGDGSTQTVPAESYTLSGTLTDGTSTVTVSYGGKTTTFSVTVTEDTRKSDMDGWTDGIAYTDLEIVENSYVAASTGNISSYNGWNRTGYVPCDGATSITFPTMPQTDSGKAVSNWFYKQDKTALNGGAKLPFELSKTDPVTISVPEGAYYFIISSDAAALASCVNAGIVPHA